MRDFHDALLKKLPILKFTVLRVATGHSVVFTNALDVFPYVPAVSPIDTHYEPRTNDGTWSRENLFYSESEKDSLYMFPKAL